MDDAYHDIQSGIRHFFVECIITGFEDQPSMDQYDETEKIEDEMPWILDIQERVDAIEKNQSEKRIEEYAWKFDLLSFRYLHDGWLYDKGNMKKRRKRIFDEFFILPT